VTPITPADTMNALRQMNLHELADVFARSVIILGDPDPAIVAELEAMNDQLTMPVLGYGSGRESLVADHSEAQSFSSAPGEEAVSLPATRQLTEAEWRVVRGES
jgi:hypothetical protein